jgi:hypothetical protein
MTDNVADQPAERLAEFLHKELRSAGTAAKESGATVEEVTDDLTERLNVIRQLNAVEWGRAATED